MLVRKKPLTLGFSMFLAMLLALSAAVLPPIEGVEAQTGCNYSSASLNPRAAYQQSVNNYLQNIINLPLSVPRPFGFSETIVQPELVVNSADLLQNFNVRFAPIHGRGGIVFYNLNLGANFPPTGTATLPRAAFDQLGVLAYYIYAAPLTAAQLQSVQNLYAVDQVSRRNYAVNLANLARNFTALQNAGADKRVTDYAINSLRNAYNTLSNPAAPAPSPRQVYRQATNAYILLLLLDGTFNQPDLSKYPDLNQIPQSDMESFLVRSSDKFLALSSAATRAPIKTGLNILAIGGSNYDTNRLPVPNGNNMPTASTCAGCFPLPAYDGARITPLTQAQAAPDQVFGQNVLSFAKRFGLLSQFTGVPRTAQSFIYQVNSADQLQFVYATINSTTTYLAFFFARGFPVNGPANQPEFAFSSNTAASASYFFDARFGVTYSAARQAALEIYYADPANAGRRANYGRNLQNLICAYQKIQQDGNLTAEQTVMVKTALETLIAAQSRLNSGGLPDIFLTYKTVSENTPFFIFFNNPNATASQNTLSEAIRMSLNPIGIINYYCVPIVLGNIN